MSERETAAPEPERNGREFAESMWKYAKHARETYVRIDGAWHPTQPHLPLPANATGFKYDGPSGRAVTTWGEKHDAWI